MLHEFLMALLAKQDNHFFIECFCTLMTVVGTEVDSMPSEQVLQYDLSYIFSFHELKLIHNQMMHLFKYGVTYFYIQLQLNAYFETLNAIVTNNTLLPIVKFKILDLIDLKKV